MPPDPPVGLPARHAAGLLLGGLLFAYWAVAAELLVAVAVASLVVAGERASALGRLTGRFRLRAVPVAVAVELSVALLAALEGAPGLGLLAGGLFLLGFWLAGATPRPDRGRGDRPRTTPVRGRPPGD